MDLVHVWYGDRYWSKILQGINLNPVHDLKIEVTDLEFLGRHYFQTLWWIWFMLGMMIDTGPKFYKVPSPYPIHDLKVKVMDFEFYVKVLC